MSQKSIPIGSDIANFKKTVDISLALLNEIKRDHFISPYSTVPLIAQMLGLNTPMMGSGDSPYSIISVIFQLQKKALLFRKIFKIPLEEKRKIIDEIYDMFAPSLLEEESEFIDLLASVKYKHILKGEKTNIKKFEGVLKEKFLAIRPFIEKFSARAGDFGYIVHYGYPEDLYREHEFLRVLPESLAIQWKSRSYPIVNEIVLKNFPVHENATKKTIKGWVIFIPNYTRELLEDGRLRKRKILQAALLAEKLGSKVIGMGGLVASFAQGGKWLAEQIKNVGFSTGHAYTIGNISEIIDKSSVKIRFDLKKATIAVIGAAGSIGSGCAKLLAEKKPKNIILIDRNFFDAVQKLNELQGVIRGISPHSKISVAFKFKDIKNADIVIIATNSPTSFIKPEYLKSGAIVIDDSFPKNVPKGILKKRNDIILLEGGIMQLPIDIDIYFARNMPDLMDAPLTRIISCKETYGCFAEILVLALYNYHTNYGLGYADVVLAKDILSKAKKVGFSSAPLQCFDEAIEEERVEKIIGILKRQLNGCFNAN